MADGICGNRRSLVIRQDDRRRCIGTGKLEYDAGNIVLRVCGQTACDLQGLIRQLGHVLIIRPLTRVA